MSVQIPNAEGSFLPQVPAASQLQGDRLHEYLQSLRREVERISLALFDNDKMIVNAINSGCSISATSTVKGLVVTSGIVISVTT